MVANIQPPDSPETWQRLVERIEQAEEGLRARDQALLAQQATLTSKVERLEREIARLEGTIADLTPVRAPIRLAVPDREPERGVPLARDRSELIFGVLLVALAAVGLGSVPLLGSPTVLYTIAAIALVIPAIFALQQLERRRRQSPPLSPGARGIVETVGQDMDRLLRERTGR